VKAQDILGSPPFIILGVAIARLMPRRFGYWLSRRMARRLARRRSHLFRTLRANLAVVTGKEGAALDALAEKAIYHAGVTYIDMFRRLPGDYTGGRVSVQADAAAWAEADRILSDGRGTMVVGPHTSNYDLAAMWIAGHGFEMQALSLSSPDTGTRLINGLRRRRGVLMTPIDVQSLRLAVKRLREGGVCLTGVDRPVPESEPLYEFFGRPAHMPDGHVRLALQTNARVLIACCHQDEAGEYTLRVEPPMEMERTGDRERDVAHNVRRVLAVIEDMILEAPEQWLMFLPVWGEEEETR
jgi:KDO2-lipid IV(A) lauroyltransferase